MKLHELTPHQGVETALRILLEKGFKSEYYADWKEYTKSYDGEDPDDWEYSLTEMSAAWEALLENVPQATVVAGDEGLAAKFVGTQDDGPAHDSEVYYVVLALTDGTEIRYFKHDGWYASYDGGHLEEGEASEVFPKAVTVISWTRESND